MAYNSVLSMMRGAQGGGGGMAPIPTQTYNAENILGTAVPQVGDSKARPDYGQAVSGTGARQVVIVALILILVGYVAYHLNFEK